MGKVTYGVDRSVDEDSVGVFLKNGDDGAAYIFGEVYGELAEYLDTKLTRADALAEACIIKTENAYSECAICHETWHPADPEIHLENCALAAYREETK